MKRNIYIVIVLILINFGCTTTLKISEIKDLAKIEFDSLFIQPDTELYDFRIDIVRQTFDEQVNDSTTETKEEPYHKLGFNLGNGLFYDLNDNLSLRVDYLLNIDTKNDFEIEKLYSKSKWNKKFENHEGKFTTEYSNRKKTFNQFTVNSFNDSLSISYENKHRYSIVKNDSLAIYMSNKRIIDRIQKEEENYYYQKHGRNVYEYKFVDKAIILDNKYKVRLNQSADVIEIIRIGKKKDYPLYKIIRDTENLYIYSDQFYGKKIVMNDGKFTLFYNDKFGYEIRNAN